MRHQRRHCTMVLRNTAPHRHQPAAPSDGIQLWGAICMGMAAPVLAQQVAGRLIVCESSAGSVISG